MGSAAALAVWNDRRRFSPSALPAVSLPDASDLDLLLGGRALLHYCRSADAGSILAAGLWPGSWCTVHPLEGHVADIWLGTPRRKDYVIAFDPSGIGRYKGPGSAPPDGSDPLRTGGGLEIYLPDGAPASAVVTHGPLEAP
jgi:hypothetical protein